jgi:hypothetical protein
MQGEKEGDQTLLFPKSALQQLHVYLSSFFLMKIQTKTSKEYLLSM